MLPSMRFGSARMLGTGAPKRMLFACVFILMAVQIPFYAPLGAEEAKSCILSFAPPDSAIFHYKAFNQTVQSYGGSDVTLNQTAEVDMSSAGKSEEGYCKVNLKFKKVTASLVSNNQLMDWEPPIKLEGSNITVTVSRGGEVIGIVPGGSIAGLRNSEILRELVEAWFIKLPDTMITVGQTWKEEVLEGKKEGQAPEVKGEIVYVLKKIEKKGKITVAFVEGKAVLKMNMDTPAGLLVADSKTDIKAQLAAEGGYIVEIKETTELKGDAISKDPLTDKETKRQTMVTEYFECKLQQ